jgi:hypothetical protein
LGGFGSPPNADPVAGFGHFTLIDRANSRMSKGALTGG